MNKFLGLLKRGWDVHIVCESVDERSWSHFPQLAHRPDLRRRVHVGCSSRPRWLALLRLPWLILACLASNPRGTLRYLYRGRQEGFLALRRLYADAPLICTRPNIVQFEFGALAAGRMHLSDWLGCRVAVAFRGYDLNFVALDDPTFYDAVWDRAAAVHLLGRDLWKRALRRGCPETMRHVLIPPAIDTSFFNPAGHERAQAVGSSARPLRIVSVGRLEWKKGHEYGFQAVRQLVDRGVHCEYRIAGEGDYLECVAFARHELGLEDVVQFVGSCTREEIRSHLLWADVLLHPSVSEGFCNAVLEAQAMMLPVVCTDADGLSENVEHGRSGFVVPRRDPEALASGLEQLARDARLRLRFGQAGRERVLEHFGLHQQIEAFDRFYRELLEPGCEVEAAPAPPPESTELVQSR